MQIDIIQILDYLISINLGKIKLSLRGEGRVAVLKVFPKFLGEHFRESPFY